MDDRQRIQLRQEQARSSMQSHGGDIVMIDDDDDDSKGSRPGPSNLPFRNAQLLDDLGRATTASSSSGSEHSLHGTAKIRKRPAKLALVAAATAVAGGHSSKRAGATANAVSGKAAGGSGHSSYDSATSSRSVPASPITSISGGGGHNRPGQDHLSGSLIDGRDDLRDNLRGAPRRRPSILFPLATMPAASASSQSAKTPRLLPTLNIQAARKVAPDTSGRPKNVRIDSPGPSAGLPPSVWQDPSEHILSGNGSSLQHARSSYATGPIEVLPGLFLGDEFNACDEAYLVEHGITTILNVAKETTLPCQENESCRDLGFFQQQNTLTKGFGKKLSLYDEAATPTSARHPRKSTNKLPSSVEEPSAAQDSEMYSVCPTPATETFFTPATSTFAPQSFAFSPSSRAYMTPAKISDEDSIRSSLYLRRNTSSTPNLQAAFGSPPSSASFVLPGSYRPERYSSSSSDEYEDDEMIGEEESAATSSLASHVSTHTEESAPSSPQYDGQKLSPFDEVSVTTPSSSTFSRRSPATAAASTACSSSSSAGSFTIALPDNAVALSVPPSPMTGRTWPIRYVKLPWTHDETDLANLSSTGGFVTGCAIIADALAIDVRTGEKTTKHDGRRQNGGGGVLVHCQCGVSRSATLVIAFVMQAAAYEYDFERVRDLTGMHDCYEMVKGVSSSISPNISLIYQLVEWERILSRQVAQRQLEAAAAAEYKLVDGVLQQNDMDDADGSKSPHAVGKLARTPERRWGKEVMDEEDWMRMRAEEERKEEEAAAAEDSQRKIEDVRAREAEWRAAQQHLPSLASTAIAQPPPRPAAPPLTLTGAGVGARRKKPSPSLNIVNSSKTKADQMLDALPAAPSLPSATTVVDVRLLPPPSESEEDDGERNVDDEQKLPAAGVLQKSYSEAPPLTPCLTDAALKRTISDHQARAAVNRPTCNTLNWLTQSDRRSSSRPNSGYGIASFGATGQSAAERRMKHKRTFSAEVPDWKTIVNANSVRQPSIVAAATNTLAPSIGTLDSHHEHPIAE